MADLAMCRDKECPARERCFRFTAKPSAFLQTYGMFGRNPRAQYCAHYWPTTKEQHERLSRELAD